MDAWGSFESNVAESVKGNSIIFLNRAAYEITRHNDAFDKAFSHETGTVVAVLTQMALELAMAAYLIRHHGVRSILVDDEGLTDEQIRDRWEKNLLRTKKFEQYKAIISSRHGGIYASFDGMIEAFQGLRNKIMHLHFRFDEGDLYDLKFESTFILIKIVSHLIFDGDFDHSQNVSTIFPEGTLSKLVRFEPYQMYVQKIAEDYSNVVLRCPMCEQRAFSDSEMKCFSCTFEYPHLSLLKCPECKVVGVLYDHLNLDINDSMPSLCLHCADRREVIACDECRSAFVRTTDETFCSPECEADAQAMP